jgi:hypothetical protein
LELMCGQLQAVTSSYTRDIPCQAKKSDSEE